MGRNNLKEQLSKRLQAVMELLTPVETVADVGCDHGYVAISLIEQKKAKKVIAMDINRGPLARAGEHIGQFGMEQRIETRLSDGVEALKPGEADAVILAGMGGKLVTGILERGFDRVSQMKELILQPQSELAYVRKWLRMHGFIIDAEAMVCEDGKYYPMMRVLPTNAHADNAGDGAFVLRVEDRYGPKLLGQADPVLLQFLNREQMQYEEILCTLKNSSASNRRMKEIEELLDDIARVKAYYYSIR